MTEGTGISAHMETRARTFSHPGRNKGRAHRCRGWGICGCAADVHVNVQC